VSSGKRDIEQMIRQCRRDGWTIVRTRKHYKWIPPDGGDFFITAVTPSDSHVIANIRSHIKRALAGRVVSG
jgi:hypothetical protein